LAAGDEPDRGVAADARDAVGQHVPGENRQRREQDDEHDVQVRRRRSA
jgi:hypothetical protein